MIHLEYKDGHVMVFDAETVLRLRRDYRIVGALEASHPTNPQQNNYYGLPLVLLPEEVALLSLDPSISGLDTTQLLWPRSEYEKVRFDMYRDLHSRGFFITRGIKFGADYMLYPGEPMRYHSHYVVSLVEHDQAITPRELVALGRLGTSVKKTRFLCSWDASTQKFVYVSLDWSEIG
ncbi:tRNA-splicing endonuclease subunit [Coemansia sp. RSA 1836]|nr:tRNA-splicing endonuclease subunit [Coemansia sp. RSA 25]KAJ2337579.1 tRNA-splicing endonuclease subunit [Coemansia sp. RSA 2681]KAJ2441374.1 tRNA-splicing endonuclease subunit [Coemansia sp. RSA 2424]KAJ2508023.1 tRNA-splicing endonuclease subunit [Coemansia sp. RSA 2052]KAJ2581991.1 tRNA-splicing endonuclease subunit [Coemansia sp. RSA 1836]